jgi:(1->4)-alpha-D-glucan 1-alpha-D-glucosylmutase
LQGDYVAVDSSEHSFAFERTLGEDRILCVVPRFTRRLAPDRSAFTLGNVWGDLAIRGVTAGRYQNLFTDELLSVDPDGDLPLAQVFASFPVALLVKDLP